MVQLATTIEVASRAAAAGMAAAARVVAADTLGLATEVLSGGIVDWSSPWSTVICRSPHNMLSELLFLQFLLSQQSSCSLVNAVHLKQPLRPTSVSLLSDGLRIMEFGNAVSLIDSDSREPGTCHWVNLFV